jgi:hypothetical protein
MLNHRFLFGLVLATTLASSILADDQKPKPDPTGVVIERRGPPEGGDFKIDYLIKLKGETKFTRYLASISGYRSTAVEGEIIHWKNDGFVLEVVRPTQVRFIGKKGADGKVVPVVEVKFESKDLRPDQLPTVVTKKQKG